MEQAEAKADDAEHVRAAPSIAPGAATFFLRRFYPAGQSRVLASEDIVGPHRLTSPPASSYLWKMFPRGAPGSLMYQTRGICVLPDNFIGWTAALPGSRSLLVLCRDGACARASDSERGREFSLPRWHTSARWPKWLPPKRLGAEDTTRAESKSSAFLYATSSSVPGLCGPLFPGFGLQLS